VSLKIIADDAVKNFFIKIILLIYVSYLPVLFKRFYQVTYFIGDLVNFRVGDVVNCCPV